MKLWLLEILACPIDKAYPLDLTILKWKNEITHPNQLEQLIKGYHEGNVLTVKMETPIKKEVHPDGELYLNDLLVLKPTKFQLYLQQLLEGIAELSNVRDKSGWGSLEALNLIKNEINEKLMEAKKLIDTGDKQEQEKIFQTILTPLEFLNIFKYEFEIEDAVIKCPQCKRWFPVFENIPQMLPDEVRDSKTDQHFLEKWKDQIQL